MYIMMFACLVFITRPCVLVMSLLRSFNEAEQSQAKSELDLRTCTKHVNLITKNGHDDRCQSTVYCSASFEMTMNIQTKNIQVE